VQRPDSITASAVSAREDIARAVAEKIRAVDDSRDLKRIAEDVLPKLEKFLESPEEKRLRRLRAGVIVAAAGLGFASFMLLMTSVVHGPDVEGFVAGVGIGAAAFFVGLGVIINGLVFTRLGKRIEDNARDPRLQNLLDVSYAPPQLRPSGEASPTFRSQTTSNLVTPSVTEHTTHHLKSKGEQ
jgi:hypothetical protein